MSLILDDNLFLINVLFSAGSFRSGTPLPEYNMPSLDICRRALARAWFPQPCACLKSIQVDFESTLSTCRNLTKICIHINNWEASVVPKYRNGVLQYSENAKYCTVISAMKPEKKRILPQERSALSKTSFYISCTVDQLSLHWMYNCHAGMLGSKTSLHLSAYRSRCFVIPAYIKCYAW